MNGFFIFGSDNGQGVYFTWNEEVAGSNPVLPTKVIKVVKRSNAI